jgi:hypothetical protein
MRMIRNPLTVLAAGILLLAGPAALHAQLAWPPALGTPSRASTLTGWQGDATLLGANALLGGITAGVWSALRGESFGRAFITGAGGGALGYAGRRVSVLDWQGAGVVGREVTAVGASMVGNAGVGRGALEQIVLALGPARVYVDRSNGTHWRVKLNAYEMYWLLASLRDPALDFQLEASLCAGAPVFVKTGQRVVLDGVELNGYQVGGVVVLSGITDVGEHRTLVHERVHIYQSDFIARVWTEPAEDWLMERNHVTRFVHRFVDAGVMDALLRSGLEEAGFRYANSAQEFEAHFLKTRH